MISGYKKEDIKEDIKKLARSVELGYLNGYPYQEEQEEETYHSLILPQLLRQDLDAYNYMPKYKQTSEFIMNAYWDIMSNRTTCDEIPNWLKFQIDNEINHAFWEKERKDKEIEQEAEKYSTYIPESVATGVRKRRHLNKYQKEIQNILDKFYREKEQACKKLSLTTSTFIGDYSFQPYWALVNRASILLVEDLKYYDFLPKFLQKDQRIIDTYATVMNSNYWNYYNYVPVAIQYYKEVEICWSQYNKIQKEENKYPKKYLTYIPDEVETGIPEVVATFSRTR